MGIPSFAAVFNIQKKETGDYTCLCKKRSIISKLELFLFPDEEETAEGEQSYGSRFGYYRGYGQVGKYFVKAF